MRARRFSRIVVSLAPFTLFATPAALAAQGEGGTRPITPDAYEQWKSINSPTLTADGRWAIYTIVPQIGEGTLVARSTSNATEYRATRGYIARPTLTPSGNSGFTLTPPSITADSRWVVFTIEPSRTDIDRARRAKMKPADQPKASLGILDLSSGQTTTVPRVRSFRVARACPGDDCARAHPVAAYLLEPDSGAAAPAADADSANRKAPGTPLVIRDLASGKEVRVADVASYAVADSGTAIAYAVSTKDDAGDGVFAMTYDGMGPIALAKGPGRYQSLTFDRSGRQIAFLSDRGEYPKAHARFALYEGGVGAPAREVVSADAPGSGMIVAANATMRFSKSGDALLFGVGPTPLEQLPNDSLTERAVFDLWNYKDEYLQPTQQKNAAALRAPWYTAVFWPATSRWVRLGSDTVNDIMLGADTKIGLAISVFPYRVEGMWGPVHYDLYTVDPTTGSWTKFKTAMPASGGNGLTYSRSAPPGDVALSPSGKYVMMYEHGRWRSYNTASKKTTDLTGRLAGVRFDDELDDHPYVIPPRPIVGWTPSDDRVILEDRFDLWAIDPSGVAAPRNLTGGLGRARHIVFRLQRVDRDEDAIDLSKPLWLAATNDETKESGLWRLAPNEKPQQVVMLPKRVTLVAKAKNADQYLVTQSTFREFPDLWTGPSITALTKMSDVNPQQREYRWGSASLITFTSTTGKRLHAILRKPDGFDPKRKYPMLVEIYERRVDGLHSYSAPAAGSGSGISPSIAVSKGYVMLEPDIVYDPAGGHPGDNALASVVGAVKAMIDSGYIDSKRVGLLGHSWGGYQTAYIVTRSHLFAAASPGAPVVNMTSAYGGIRWSTGINRAWQYEKHQSRMGGTPWDRPELYLEESALFHLPNVTTPLLIIHNDNDGAVPWYQGIEFFIGLRRLGKEAYFIDYNGEEHGLAKTANRLDWDMRTQQFFDHFLLGTAAPAWMTNGIPYVMKGRDQSPIVQAGGARHVVP